MNRIIIEQPKSNQIVLGISIKNAFGWGLFLLNNDIVISNINSNNEYINFAKLMYDIYLIEQHQIIEENKYIDNFINFRPCSPNTIPSFEPRQTLFQLQNNIKYRENNIGKKYSGLNMKSLNIELKPIIKQSMPKENIRYTYIYKSYL
jgi:hypothetical protein